MKIVCLAENTALRDDIEAEHGLSLYIETKNHKILFDMGQTDMLLRNAEKLGVDLSEVDIAVLSHGHYDHGGGLSAFLGVNKKAPVYISTHAFGEHYNGCEKYIGLDKKLKSCDRLVFTDDDFQIDEDLCLYHCNGKKKRFELGSFGLNIREDGVFKSDPFLHEQYLEIMDNGKKILISGCSHKGILNISEWFSPDVLVGGFHFSKLPLDCILADYARFLDGLGCEFYTCHCTGEAQYEFMKSHMKKLRYLHCGETVGI